jgi:RNAse (barnase) inhibitor barstar
MINRLDNSPLWSCLMFSLTELPIYIEKHVTQKQDQSSHKLIDIIIIVLV